MWPIRKRTIISALLGWGLLLLYAVSQRTHIAEVVASLQEPRPNEDVTSSPAFVLTSEWLTFPIDGQSNMVRVLSNAVLKKPVPELDFAQPHVGWDYEVEWELLDNFGATVDSNRTHLRTRIVEYLHSPASDVADLTRFLRTRLQDPLLVPAGTRQLFLSTSKGDSSMHTESDRGDVADLASSPAVAEAKATGIFPRHTSAIRIRLVAAHPALHSVLVRVLVQIERARHDDPFVWHRVSRDRKERLCRAEIYPPELLSIPQRVNLLRWMWVPTAPIGTAGDDYTRLTFFHEQGDMGIPIPMPDEPDRQILLAGFRRIVRLPVGLGTVSLDLRSRLASSTHEDRFASRESGRRGPVTLRRFDAGQQLLEQIELGDDHEQQRFPSGVTHYQWRCKVAGGWIELDAHEDVSVMSSWLAECEAEKQGVHNSRIELELPKSSIPLGEPTFAQAYRCDAALLRFDIHHIDGRPTPVRLRLRGLVHVNSAPSSLASEIAWQVLDAESRLLRQGVLTADSTPSVLDQVADRTSKSRVSEPRELFWHMPAEARSLVVTASAGTPLVEVATRPTPEPDRKAGTIPSELLPESMPSWFPIRPQHHHGFVQSQQTCELWQGARAPEPLIPLVVGSYHWQDFRPTGAWSGRELLVPFVNDDEAVRDPALASTFFPIDSNQEVELDVKATHESVDVTVVAVAGSAGGTVHFAVDNQTIALPPFHVAHHQLRGIRAGTFPLLARSSNQEIRLMVNHQRVGAEIGYRRRLAAELASEGLLFPIAKETEEEELLMLDLFAVQGDLADDPLATRAIPVWAELLGTALDASLDPNETWPQTQWNFSVVRDDVAGQSGYVLGTSDRVHVQRQYLRLDARLPPSHYMLRLRGDTSCVVYAHVSRLLRGDYPVRGLRRPAVSSPSPSH